MKEITKVDAISIFLRACDKDDPFWEMQLEKFIEDSDDDDMPLPTPEDLMLKIGVTKVELEKAAR